jgi:serine/threonine-protein kinase
LDFDATHVTFNGEQKTTDVKKDSEWWAFHSSCTSTRCVAVGTQLVDSNPQAPSGAAAVVLEFTDGRWQDRPRLQAPAPCDEGTGAEWLTKSWSLQPDPDGTLRGAETATILTNECGSQGNVVKFPMVVTRIGDVPPAVLLADPALFLS